MTAQDFYDAFQDSGWTRGLEVLPPSIIGMKVGTYPDKARADWLDEPLEYRAEQQRFGQPRSFLEHHRSKDKDIPDETPEEFTARKSLADQWMQTYGRALPMSDAYRQATPDQQKASLDLLKKRIITQSSKDEDDRDLSGLIPEILMSDVRDQEQNRQEQKEELKRKRAIPPPKATPPAKAVLRTQ